MSSCADSEAVMPFDVPLAKDRMEDLISRIRSGLIFGTTGDDDFDFELKMVEKSKRLPMGRAVVLIVGLTLGDLPGFPINTARF